MLRHGDTQGARLFMTCDTSVARSFRNLPIKIRKNYETLYLRFRDFRKRKEQNYETRDNAVTCIDTSHFGGVS